MPPQQGQIIPLPRSSGDDHVTRFLAVIGFLGFVVAALIGALFWRGHGVPAISTGTRAQAEFLTTGGGKWYTVSGSSLVAAAGPAGLVGPRLTVVEAAAPVGSGATPILAKLDGQKGELVGLLNKVGQFLPLVTDSSEKLGLASLPDGRLAYSVIVPPVAPKPTKGKPPPILLAPPSPTFAAYYVDAQAKTPTAVALGAGLTLGFAPDGVLLVAAADGIDRVELGSGKRAPFINTPSLVESASLAPGGTMLALVNPSTRQINAYRIDPSSATVPFPRGIFGELERSVAFASDGALLSMQSDGTFARYVFDSATSSMPSAQQLTLVSSSAKP